MLFIGVIPPNRFIPGIGRGGGGGSSFTRHWNWPMSIGPGAIRSRDGEPAKVGHRPSLWGGRARPSREIAAFRLSISGPVRPANRPLASGYSAANASKSAFEGGSAPRAARHSSFLAQTRARSTSGSG